MMYSAKNFTFLIIFFALLLFSCRSTRLNNTDTASEKVYHSSYDNATLSPSNNSLLLPYNRFIDPAGTVIRFGNAGEENHSLDCALLPDGKILAVEDRYGIAFIDVAGKQLLFHLDYTGDYEDLMSTYSGIETVQIGNDVHIFWGASDPSAKKSFVLDAVWNGSKASIKNAFTFTAVAPAPLALPNDVALAKEGNEYYLYAVLNGNNQLSKIRISDKKTIWTTSTGMAPFGVALTADDAYVTNWAGPVPDSSKGKEMAGIPYGNAYINPVTGATAKGSVSIIDMQSGKLIAETEAGLHPNAIITSKNNKFLYVANGNSDNISVINTGTNTVVDSIAVQLPGLSNDLIGHSPNALALDETGTKLFVANGMDNAIAVIHLGSAVSENGTDSTQTEGFIPTEAYPSGLVITNNTICVTNLEGEGARVEEHNAYNSHHQQATVSIISLPGRSQLEAYTTRVQKANMVFRSDVSKALPRTDAVPQPVPLRIGEPSVIKHVVYIIKENRTYDQVLGDMAQGNGKASLCIYGDSVTPNQHQLAKDFLLLDNFYASGKSSAEGHSWTDAAIVTDYIEKNVRAWFRSYPHVLYDAMAYNKEGFIWNNALDHGKSVRVYGEACIPQWQGNNSWKDVYQLYLDKKPFEFKNVTTISRVRPVLSDKYPCYDSHKIPDQMRAEAFISELKEYEKMPGDQWPQLMVVALPADHTSGMSPGFPTPRAMVADNDLALGKIIEAITHSRFWDSTAVFVTEDDSQDGWDHVSAYRTTGFIISPYSRMQKTVHTNYNQTCIVRTIEQILGLPPMNIMDATALPMFDCFKGTFNNKPYAFLQNKVPLDEMNKNVTSLQGKAKDYALLSGQSQFDHIDGGNDDLLNRILWFAAKGDEPYPASAKSNVDDNDDKDDD